MVTLAMILSILNPIALWGFKVLEIVALVTILIYGWGNGALLGATTGLMMGLTYSCLCETSMSFVVAMAFSGFISGFLRRFGNKILVDQPNKDEKMQFLTKRLKNKESSVLDNRVTEAGMKNVAERTPGESLGIPENILALSFRNAARNGKQLDDELLDEAMEEYYYGEKKKRDEEQAYRTAVHEASHAYIYSLSGKKPTYLTV